MDRINRIINRINRIFQERPGDASGKMRSGKRLALAAVLLLLPGAVPAGGEGAAAAPLPSVAQVLAACARGAAAGGRGLDAAMCEWYTAPCGCKPGEVDSEADRWCLPPDEPIERISHRVIAALGRAKDQSAPIDRILPPILARLYPCTGPAGR